MTIDKDQPATDVYTASAHVPRGTAWCGFNADWCWCGATGIPRDEPATCVYSPAGNYRTDLTYVLIYDTIQGQTKKFEIMEVWRGVL